MARRTWFVWHSWIGLTAGLLLFVICWSGTFAVFSHELDALANPAIQAPPSSSVAWGAIHDNIRQHRPDLSITQIKAPLRSGYAAEVVTEDKDGVLGRVYADPASGRILGETSYFNIQRFFRSLHMSLFIGGWEVAGIPLGYLVVGLMSLPLLASLVTAIIFYKRWWRRFSHLEWHKGARVFWSDLHKLAGVWSLWFVLLIGLTGLWYLVEWKAPFANMPEVKAISSADRPLLPIDRLVARAVVAHPRLDVRVVTLYRADEGIVGVQGQDGTLLVRDRATEVTLDARGGQVLAVRRVSDLSLYDRWIDTADPLHFGNFGGLVSQAIWFFFGTGLSGLCLSGAYLQAKRQQRAHGNRHARPALIGAYAVTTAILVAAVWHAGVEIKGYSIGRALPSTPPGVDGAIALWLASTMVALSLWMRAVR